MVTTDAVGTYRFGDNPHVETAQNRDAEMYSAACSLLTRRHEAEREAMKARHSQELAELSGIHNLEFFDLQKAAGWRK